jgi:hypothetical protein
VGWRTAVALLFPFHPQSHPLPSSSSFFPGPLHAFHPGTYLEIFGRKNNLRDFWVTVGNEVTGKGPPREDVEALAGGAARVPGAVYGAAR